MSRDEDIGPRDERELLEDIEDALLDLTRAQTILAMLAVQTAEFDTLPPSIKREAEGLWKTVMGDSVYWQPKSDPPAYGPRLS
jgi:hypothetical protein